MSSNYSIPNYHTKNPNLKQIQRACIIQSLTTLTPSVKFGISLQLQLQLNMGN
ncbi:hypothetical protein Hanom_Chr10g00942161 [Helianthus anomalus]